MHNVKILPASQASNKCKEIAKTSDRPLNANVTKNKLLILSDETGKGINYALHQKLNKFDVLSFTKPAASLRSVVENLESLTKNLGKNDFACIIAGKNDFSRNRYPSLKFLREKLLQCCPHINVIISSVPYSWNNSRNQKIFDYNTSLNECITKLNKVTEGNFLYYEINNENFVLNKNIIAKDLSKLLVDAAPIHKTLIYVSLTDQVTINNNEDKAITGETSVVIVQDEVTGDDECIGNSVVIVNLVESESQICALESRGRNDNNLSYISLNSNSFLETRLTESLTIE